MTDVCKHEGNKVLLVEGKNDCHVIMALCEYFDVPDNFGIYECNGISGVLKRLNALMVSSEPPDTVGIVLDADAEDVETRWRKASEKIKHHGYEFPPSPLLEGSIIQGPEEKPSVGIWLMPNNRTTGMLEDLLLEMVEEKAINAVKHCIEYAKEKGVANFRAQHLSKAYIHTVQ